MKIAILKSIMPLAAGAILLAGCVTEQQQEAPAPEMPPPPETEVIPPQPNLTFVWTPGYWDWRGRWVWVGGYWGSRPHPGAIWVQGRWIHRGHRNVWVRPHWQ